VLLAAILVIRPSDNYVLTPEMRGPILKHGAADLRVLRQPPADPNTHFREALQRSYGIPGELDQGPTQLHSRTPIFPLRALPASYRILPSSVSAWP
jgi:hypothetical protein